MLSIYQIWWMWQDKTLTKYKTSNFWKIEKSFISQAMCKPRPRPRPILISYFNKSFQTHTAALPRQDGWAAKNCMESEGICKWLGMPWSLFRGNLPERGRRRVQRERWRTRDRESRGLRKWEEIQGRANKKDRGQGLVWLVCGDLRRANAVSLPSGSLAPVWSLRNTPAQQPSREHVKTRSPKVTLVLPLSREELESARTIPLGQAGRFFSVLFTPPLVCLHNPFVHPLMTLAAAEPFRAQTHDPLVVFHGEMWRWGTRAGLWMHAVPLSMVLINFPWSKVKHRWGKISSWFPWQCKTTMFSPPHPRIYLKNLQPGIINIQICPKIDWHRTRLLIFEHRDSAKALQPIHSMETRKHVSLQISACTRVTGLWECPW